MQLLLSDLRKVECLTYSPVLFHTGWTGQFGTSWLQSWKGTHLHLGTWHGSPARCHGNKRYSARNASCQDSIKCHQKWLVGFVFKLVQLYASTYHMAPIRGMQTNSRGGRAVAPRGGIGVEIATDTHWEWASLLLWLSLLIGAHQETLIKREKKINHTLYQGYVHRDS